MRYSFNQGGGAVAVDETGMAFDAELHAGAGWADGRFGAAIDLSPSGGYLRVPAENSDRLDFDTLSISVWIHPSAIGDDDHYIVSRHPVCCNGSTGYDLRIDPAGLLSGEIWQGSTQTLASVSGARPIPPNQWTHVALTFDGDLPRLFVDGVEDSAAVSSQSDGVQVAGDPLTLGALVYDGGAHHRFEGRIDEFRLYDRALESAEIAALHAAPGGEPGLLFYESFDSDASVLANGGTGDDYQIESGLLGHAVRIPSEVEQALEFPTAGNIDFGKGTISFWFKPDWDGDVAFEHYLFEMYDDGDHPPLQLRKWYGGTPALNNFTFRFDGVVDGVICSAKPCSRQVNSNAYEPDATMRWKAGEWHHIAVSWDFTAPEDRHFMAFIIDGVVGEASEQYRVAGSFDAPRFAVGSRFNGAIPADGWIDDLRIYAEPAFTSRNPTAAFIDATRGDGVWQPHETIHNSARDAARMDDAYQPLEDVFFYSTPPFAAVYEGTVPDPSQVVQPPDSARYRSAIGDRQTLFFNVYSRVELTGATLTVSSLTGSAGAIGSESIDLRVVKNWWQASAGPERSFYPPVYTPELLLSDDRFDFGSQTWSKDVLPSLPRLEYAVCDMDSYTSKQFAIEVLVPVDADPGTYSGVVTLVAPGLTDHAMGIELEVLDIELGAPDKDFILYHRGNFHLVSDADYLDESRYEEQIRDIREHGFNRIHLRASDTGYFDKVAAAGFSELAVSQVRDGAILDAMLAHGMEPFFYGVDEPNDLDRIQGQIERSREIHSLCSEQGCGKVITAIAKQWADRLWDRNDPIYGDGEYEPLDYANLNVTASEAYIGARRRGERDGLARKEYPQVYYWQLRREDPRVNRYYAGFHLWLTELDGIYPYVYQQIQLDPYDDFDIAEGGSYHAATRDAQVTYPSQQGPVATMEWEALREGIDDYRYLQVWAGLVKQVESFDEAEAERSAAAVDAALEKYRAADALEAIDIAAYDADRQLIAAEILALKAMISVDPAIGEQSIASTIEVGSYDETHRADLVTEQVSEVVGKGKNARSRLEHHWLFEVAGTDPADLYLLARVADPDSDAFEISYSIDGGSSWSTPLFAVDSATLTAYTSPLPVGAGGAVIVRARDTNRDRGETNRTRLVIDRMYIRSALPAPCASPLRRLDARTSGASACPLRRSGRHHWRR